MDLTHVSCSSGGQSDLVAFLHSYDRMVVGMEFVMRGCAKEVMRVIESARIARLSVVRTPQSGSIIGRDNGITILNNTFRGACRFHSLSQAFSSPFTPESDGFFKSSKEEIAWQEILQSYDRVRFANDAGSAGATKVARISRSATSDPPAIALNRDNWRLDLGVALQVKPDDFLLRISRFETGNRVVAFELPNLFL